MVTVNKGFNHPFYILFKKERVFLIIDATLANWQGKGGCMKYISVFQRTAKKKRERGRDKERGREEEEEENGGKEKKKGT